MSLLFVTTMTRTAYDHQVPTISDLSIFRIKSDGQSYDKIRMVHLANQDNLIAASLFMS